MFDPLLLSILAGSLLVLGFTRSNASSGASAPPSSQSTYAPPTVAKGLYDDARITFEPRINPLHVKLMISPSVADRPMHLWRETSLGLTKALALVLPFGGALEQTNKFMILSMVAVANMAATGKFAYHDRKNSPSTVLHAPEGLTSAAAGILLYLVNSTQIVGIINPGTILATSFLTLDITTKTMYYPAKFVSKSDAQYTVKLTVAGRKVYSE